MSPTIAVLALFLTLGVWAEQKQEAPVSTTAEKIAGKFVDVTAAKGLNFRYQSSHTSKKYLLETMAAGVALLDYDNDGRLDIFLVNGAPLNDSTPKGTICRIF